MVDGKVSKKFPSSLLSGSGTVDNTSVDSAKLVGIYFSAHWCPPCRGFTPVLADFYNKVNKDGKVFEVVFVSCDRSEDQFKEYFKEMPWLAVPFGDNARKTLPSEFSVSGIPKLSILKPDGTELNVDSRADVTKGASSFETWLTK